jgi:hypothetical protein
VNRIESLLLVPQDLLDEELLDVLEHVTYTQLERWVLDDHFLG